jgi:hypothetical protein
MGYDQNKIYLYYNDTDGQPTIKPSLQFLSEWITPTSEHFEFLGDWGMLWLKM